MNWIGLAKDKEKLRAFVKVVMNLLVSKNDGKFYVAPQLVKPLVHNFHCLIAVNL
jgi:hypothetical protein